MAGRIIVPESVARKVIRSVIFKLSEMGKVRVNDFEVEPVVLISNADGCQPDYISVTRTIKRWFSSESTLEKIDSVVLRLFRDNKQYQVEVFKDGRVVYAPALTTLTPIDVFTVVYGVAGLVQKS